ncbi:MAG: tRNA 2-thiocytidine biosynthesis protein TtcA [Chlamydiales bacterium]|nr:tRNA 2-thiocytidine biosynthesis protein TtcA [Chlamydiales bacterium]
MDISIAQPPWSAHGKKLESTVRRALYQYQMLEGVDHVSIALSGGKDSLTLLFMLKAIKGRGFPDFKLSAIFVDGEFTCGAGIDIDYLRAVCEHLEVPFVVERSTQKLETLECYRCSRERRTLIFNAAKKLGATTVAFGHHRDDNAQTILMNLLQKAEFAANQPKIPMIDYGVTIIRPLIYASEEDIRIFARQHGFLRILCQCPVGAKSLRKKVEELLRDMEALCPNARHNIAKAGLQYGSDKALTP